MRANQKIYWCSEQWTHTSDWVCEWFFVININRHSIVWIIGLYSSSNLCCSLSAESHFGEKSKNIVVVIAPKCGALFIRFILFFIVNENECGKEWMEWMAWETAFDWICLFWLFSGESATIYDRRRNKQKNRQLYGHLTVCWCWSVAVQTTT